MIYYTAPTGPANQAGILANAPPATKYATMDTGEFETCLKMPIDEGVVGVTTGWW